MNSVKVLFSSIDNFIPNQDPPADPPADEASAELSQIYEDNEGENEAESRDLSESESPDPHNPSASDVSSVHKLGEEDESLNPHYSLHVLFQLLLRLPHLVVIKPLAFFWRLLLHPFSLILKSVDFDYAYHVDVQEKMDLIKHENILSNSIKSPTASSKYILPPPQRLFPLVRNPGKARRRKTLILDLDETLIHSLSKGSPRSLSGHDSNIIEIKLNSVATLYHVHRRPYCDYFLKEISKWFDLHIFTASVREYADPIIDWLENEAASDEKIFKKRYYRNDCTYRNGVGYIKDLTKFFPVEDLKNVIILDNSPVSYALNEDNGVMIEGWINDQNDKDLLNLLPMLHSLSLCIDVRFILGLRQGEKVFESYR